MKQALSYDDLDEIKLRIDRPVTALAVIIHGYFRNFAGGKFAGNTVSQIVARLSENFDYYNAMAIAHELSLPRDLVSDAIAKFRAQLAGRKCSGCRRTLDAPRFGVFLCETCKDRECMGGMMLEPHLEVSRKPIVRGC